MNWKDILKSQFADAGYKPPTDEEMNRQESAWGDSETIEQKVTNFVNKELKPMYEKEDARIKRDFPNQRSQLRALGGFEKPRPEVADTFYRLIEEAGEELFLQIVNKLLNVPRSRIIPEGKTSHLLIANSEDGGIAALRY